MKYYFLLHLLIIVAIQVVAQNGPKALKFDEFSKIPSESSSPLTDRGNRFARQILKEPRSSRAVVIYYNQRKGPFPLNSGEDWATYTQGILTNGYEISQSRIILINGGYREYATLEYWISPIGTDLPKPSPTFDKNETVICPEIHVAGDGFRHDFKRPLKFSAAVKGLEPTSSLYYEWNVSSGTIVAGQGTSIIEIDLSGTQVKRVTASVQIKGLNPECKNYDFGSTDVGRIPYKFAEIQYNYSYLAALVDGMISELQNDPSLQGYIIMYGQRVGNSIELPSRIRALRNYMTFRRFDQSKISIINGGFREEVGVELYLLPPRVEPPIPRPTVDEKFVIFTDRSKKRKRIRR